MAILTFSLAIFYFIFFWVEIFFLHFYPFLPFLLFLLLWVDFFVTHPTFFSYHSSFYLLLGRDFLSPSLFFSTLLTPFTSLGRFLRDTSHLFSCQYTFFFLLGRNSISSLRMLPSKALLSPLLYTPYAYHLLSFVGIPYLFLQIHTNLPMNDNTYFQHCL